ncbi:MAG: porin [Holosporaceae bacterium]|jgi:hypothetical protein|nr:porin [Holosporaceae bacterium]
MRGYFLILPLFLLFADTSGATRDFDFEKEFEEGHWLNNAIDEILARLGIYQTGLRIDGRVDLTTVFVNQDQKTSSDDDAVISLQGDVDLKYLNKCDGYAYGFEIGTKTNSGIIKNGNPIVKTSFLFWESDKVGSIKFGYARTAADVFSICGDKFLVGYLGAGSGNLGAFYNASAGTILDTGFPSDDSRAAKIAWTSPVVSGFSAGLSFTPDSRNANLFKTHHSKSDSLHEKADFFGMRRTYSKNIVTGGIAYEFGSPDDLNAKVSFASWLGSGKTGISGVDVHNIRAYNVGVAICYKDLQTSFGYTDNGRSLLAKKYASHDVSAFDESKAYSLTDPAVGLRPGADAGKLYSAGIAYALGKLTVSAGYFKSVVKFSDREKSKADVITFAGEYKVSRSLEIYLEYDHIATNTCDRARIYGDACGRSSTGNNRANVFMIGSKINF